MPVKYYGIYLLFPPRADLRKEGLGRHLAAFLGAASNRTDVRFIVVCPNWTRESLLELCKAEGVKERSFDIITPATKPLALRLYEAYLAYKTKRRAKWLKKILRLVLAVALANRRWLERTFATTRSALVLGILIIYLLVLGAVLLPFIIIFVIALLCMAFLTMLKKGLNKKAIGEHLKSLINDNAAAHLYQFMEEYESKLLLNQINKLKHVQAWYCPTAFWPSFNKIRAPRLMTVPDVVLGELPCAFAQIGGDRILNSFAAVEKAISGGQHYITYSETIKRDVLVNKYGIRPSSVEVVRHAPHDLSKWVNVQGFPYGPDATTIYCQTLLLSALGKAVNPRYIKGFQNQSVKFLFFASQFRPNKNILTLLRAYEYLLKNKWIGHKLILTGKLSMLPEIEYFIKERNLFNDVLFLHSLTISELAACYKLADLAVNPSLSEGGFPFTFSEALSVDTPVVMSRISVTEEIITDPELQKMMLFDPYDWKDVADRIEWALNHRDLLLSEQKAFYTKLSHRSWGDVVDEHIAILERISLAPGNPQVAI